MVSHIGHDAGSQTLAVTFHDGKTYRFKGVPQGTYDALIKAPSIGKHFAENIRGKFKAAT